MAAELTIVNALGDEGPLRSARPPLVLQTYSRAILAAVSDRSDGDQLGDDCPSRRDWSTRSW
jgi:hypothetical protein